MSDNEFCTFDYIITALTDFFVVESVIKTEYNNVGHVRGESNTRFLEIIKQTAVSDKIYRFAGVVLFDIINCNMR